MANSLTSLDPAVRGGMPIASYSSAGTHSLRASRTACDSSCVSVGTCPSFGGGPPTCTAAVFPSSISTLPLIPRPSASSSAKSTMTKCTFSQRYKLQRNTGYDTAGGIIGFLYSYRSDTGILRYPATQVFFGVAFDSTFDLVKTRSNLSRRTRTTRRRSRRRRPSLPYSLALAHDAA